MSKATAEIAKLRSIDAGSARRFCELVQRHFRERVPPFTLIAAMVRESPTASASEIAAMIGRQTGVAVLEEPRPAPKPKERTRYTVRGKSRKGGGYSLLDPYEYETPRLGWNARNEKNPRLSRTRLEPERAEKCPHGVPFYRKCAICDPEGFTESTGLE